MEKEVVLCSACLLGIKCRHDGKSRPDKKTISFLQKQILIPVCPEQLGGLATPREESERLANKVLTKSGRDVTQNFEKGAREALRLAKLFKAKKAFLKRKSPSCGCGLIYDGTFSKRIVKRDGVLTALLKKNKIKVFGRG